MTVVVDVILPVMLIGGICAIKTLNTSVDVVEGVCEGVGVVVADAEAVPVNVICAVGIAE
jgi:hypothetical protein